MLVDIHFSVLSTIFGNPRCCLKKAIGLTATLHEHHAFFVHFLTWLDLHDFDMEVPFYGGRKQYSDFLVLFLNYDTVSRRTEREEISASKFEAARIHILSDVFVAVAIVVTWVPSGSLARTRSKMMSRRLRSLIGPLSFDLVANMVLAKTKIDLIRNTRHLFTRFRIDRGRVCLSSQNNKTTLNLQNLQFKFRVIITCCEDLYRRYCIKKNDNDQLLPIICHCL